LLAVRPRALGLLPFLAGVTGGRPRDVLYWRFGQRAAVRAVAFERLNADMTHPVWSPRKK